MCYFFRSYEAADDFDLFENLDRAAKEDNILTNELSVYEMLGSWSNQAGFPVLIVNRNYDDNTITISQERHFDKYPHADANSSTWWIPYNFDTANNVAINDTAAEGWLPKGVQSMIIEPSVQKNWTNSDWVLFNKQQTGYYRVLYDLRNYQMLVKELKSESTGKIHPINRAQLIDDIKDFVSIGRLPYHLLNDINKLMKNDLPK